MCVFYPVVKKKVNIVEMSEAGATPDHFLFA